MKPARPATKPYIRMDRQDEVPLATRLFGLAFGLPICIVGTLGLIRGRPSIGLVFIGLFAAFGYFITFGVLSTGALKYEDGALRFTVLLFGRIPIYARTLVKPGDVVGLRHVRRIGTFQASDGTWLDEHFLVLATQQPREYVLEDLGTHPAPMNEAIANQAKAMASRIGLPLTQAFDGRPSET